MHCILSVRVAKIWISNSIEVHGSIKSFDWECYMYLEITLCNHGCLKAVYLCVWIEGFLFYYIP